MDSSGTSVIQVTATDADDSMYGNSAKLVYSISQGDPYFSVDPNTGTSWSALKKSLFDLKKFNLEECLLSLGLSKLIKSLLSLHC